MFYKGFAKTENITEMQWIWRWEKSMVRIPFVCIPDLLFLSECSWGSHFISLSLSVLRLKKKETARLWWWECKNSSSIFYKHFTSFLDKEDKEKKQLHVCVCVQMDFIALKKNQWTEHLVPAALCSFIWTQLSSQVNPASLRREYTFYGKVPR